MSDGWWVDGRFFLFKHALLSNSWAPLLVFSPTLAETTERKEVVHSGNWGVCSVWLCETSVGPAKASVVKPSPYIKCRLKFRYWNLSLLFQGSHLLHSEFGVDIIVYALNAWRLSWCFFLTTEGKEVFHRGNGGLCSVWLCETSVGPAKAAVVKPSPYIKCWLKFNYWNLFLLFHCSHLSHSSHSPNYLLVVIITLTSFSSQFSFFYFLFLYGRRF